jgi:hypothetical protein
MTLRAVAATLTATAMAIMIGAWAGTASAAPAPTHHAAPHNQSSSGSGPVGVGCYSRSFKYTANNGLTEATMNEGVAMCPEGRNWLGGVEPRWFNTEAIPNRVYRLCSHTWSDTNGRNKAGDATSLYKGFWYFGSQGLPCSATIGVDIGATLEVVSNGDWSYAWTSVDAGTAP